MTPLRRVVDTNVPVTANGAHEDASADCVAACGRALQQVMDGGHLFVDNAGSIAAEYRNNLAAFRDVRPGNVFLKWFLTNEWNPARVTHVTVSPRDGHPQEFAELPAPPDGVRYDPSDRIFLAVSAAHPEHPPVLQALDSKWWGWREALEAAEVTIDFVCPEEIAQKHAAKMGR
jgi:hypothetical protein